MTNSEQNNDGMKSSSGPLGFFAAIFAVVYKLAVLALLAGFVWQADQIRQEVQGSGGWTVEANVDFPSRQSVYVSGGSVDANVESVYVRGGSIDANVDFPSTGVQDVQIVAIKRERGMAWFPLPAEVDSRKEIPVTIKGHSIPIFDPLPVSAK